MPRNAAVRAEYFALGGGLDLVSPALSIMPGRALACANFEPWINGGYRRILGYERFDGRPSPSEQVFVGFQVADASQFTLGTTITGGTSGATGKLIAKDDTANWLAVTKTVGTFVIAEAVTSGMAGDTIQNTPTQLAGPDADTEATWLLAAQDDYRADIAAVPGSGPIRGVIQHQSNVYAWRDNVGATACVLHKKSPTGWTEVVIGSHYIRFDGGGGGTQAALPVVGETVTGASSSASGTVHQVVLHGGSTANDDAYGYLVLTGVTGGPFTDGENLQVSASTRAVADGGSSLWSWQDGGRFEFHQHNFYGGTGSFNLYGCNGLDPAFEIDANDVVSPILEPRSAPNTFPTRVPYLIEEFSNHLFLAFPGGLLVSSTAGEPLQINGALGSIEIGVGDEITGIKSLSGPVLAILTNREARGLYGTNITDWQLQLISETNGGVLYTNQVVASHYSLGPRGITDLARTDRFGDFVGATVSQAVQPLVDRFRQLNQVQASTVVKATNQYRLFFTDGSFLIMYVPDSADRPVEFGYGEYPDAPVVIQNSEDANGNEVIFFGAADGFVYQAEKGNNFDGEVIDSYLRLAFNHFRSPAYRKRFRRADLELAAESVARIQFASDLSYSAAEASSSQTDLTIADIPELTVFGGGGFWDSAVWDEFYWDAQSISTARANLSGTGQNISFMMYNSSATTAPFIMQGVTVHYDLRRLQR